MRILFDQGTPAPLRSTLTAHIISTAYEMGWTDLDNGALLNAAEEKFEALITTDKNLRYQQDLKGRRLAILILPTASWPKNHYGGRPVTARRCSRADTVVVALHTDFDLCYVVAEIERGKFYQTVAHSPVHLDPEVLVFLSARAQARHHFG